MPYGDGTGPWWSRGGGCRRLGFRRFQSISKEDEKEMLKSEQKFLEGECLAIKKRLAELK